VLGSIAERLKCKGTVESLRCENCESLEFQLSLVTMLDIMFEIVFYIRVSSGYNTARQEIDIIRWTAII
jgi:hypothetical protein